MKKSRVKDLIVHKYKNRYMNTNIIQRSVEHQVWEKTESNIFQTIFPIQWEISSRCELSHNFKDNFKDEH